MFFTTIYRSQTYVQRLTSYLPTAREGDFRSLYVAGSFSPTTPFLLTNTILIHHWFLQFIKMAGKDSFYYFFSETFYQKCNYITTALLLSVYVWFGPSTRKPPDKQKESCLIWNYVIQTIESIFNKLLRRETHLNYWMFVSFFILKQVIMDLTSIIINFEHNEPCTSVHRDKYIFEHKEEINTYEMNKKDYFKLRKRKTIISNVVLSLSTKTKRKIYHSISNVDTDSYNFAIDTCTSESICKHKELFVGKISPTKNIYVQGVGGQIRASGYGTIKIRIMDDDEKYHDIIIHNVLYVPQSPVNLLSPQKWSKFSKSKCGTGEMTVGDTTLLFWDERKYSKVVPHHPELGIPIMTVNDGYTKSQAFFQAAMSTEFCQPCTPSYLQTSYALDIKGKDHIIPIQDDEVSIHLLDQPEELNTSVPIENISEVKHSSRIDLMNSNDSVSNISDTSSQLSFETDMEEVAKQGVIPSHLADIKPPLCVPCMMGKQHKKPWRSKGRTTGSIRKDSDSFPGARTSVDQMISPFGGLIPQMKGRLMRAKYYAATVFVDHFSDYTYVHLMQDTTAQTTLEAKNAYELLLSTYGRKAIAYHADNGRFAERVFIQDTKDKGQQITYCGVGSHHQNGIVERRIRTLGEDARTMLAHGRHLWPEVVTPALWPFAYKAAARARNKFKLDENNLSPEMKLSGVKTSSDIKNEHPLFCPVFVLHKSLQGSLGGIPKWEPRSNAGVYLGNSPHHAGNVALVLSLTTGLVSLQYHVVFDDDFSTVKFIHSNTEPTNWENLCKFHTEDYQMNALPTEDTVYDLQADFNFHHPELNADSNRSIPSNDSESDSHQSVSSHPDEHQEGDSNAIISNIQSSEGDSASSSSEGDLNSSHHSTEIHSSEGAEPQQQQLCRSARIQALNESASLAKEPTNPPPLRRSARLKAQQSKIYSAIAGKYKGKINGTLKQALGLMVLCFSSLLYSPVEGYVAYKTSIEHKLESFQAKQQYYQEAVSLNIDGSINCLHPLSLATQTAGNEVFHFHQAMKQPDQMEFIKAMETEIKAHTDNNHWELVHRSQIGNSQTIKAIWSFKRKRRPDGSLLKHKARLCAHGGMQIYGETYWDTYAPVVNWISVRMMLSLAIIHKLHTTSVDFVLAFPQADVDVEIFMEIPAGVEVPEGDYVCKLLKNLYGLRQAAKTWFDHLRDSLLLPVSEGGYGFKQSKVDPCIFYKEHITLIVWVDDCLIFTDDKSHSDSLVEALQAKFVLTEEEDVSSYLGLQLDIDAETGKVTMSQPFLIDKIIASLGDAVTEANTKDSPAVYKEILHKDTDGPERKQSWSYRSVIGMLNYLAASTRPDILYAVHQCARFSAAPKLSHERAVKRIVKYLKGTRDKGIIMSPDKEKGIQCFVDADFASGFSDEARDDPIAVFSRTGYVLMYFNCPVLWVSKLQTEISLSTVEAEYIALSQSMRDIIPFLDQLNELDSVFQQDSPKPVIHCKLFEDNNGALELAKAPRYRPRTKHIAIKYHHFREHVRSGKVSIHAIDTNEQIADQFTKALPSPLFKYLRSKLIGW